MNGSKVVAGLVVLAGLAGCGKDEAKPAGATADAGTSASSGSATTTAGDAGATKAPAAAGKATFAGTYAAKPATLYIPDHKDWAAVKQAKSDDTKLVGEGGLTLEVDAASGVVTGSIESGPAAPAVIDATKSGDEIRGTVRRKDPSDQGLTGVLLATVEGTKVTGKLTLSEANAAMLREAAFSAEKK